MLSGKVENSQATDILRELGNIESLVSLPEVYLKIRRAMADVASDIDDFAEIIRMDPNLSGTVLRVINSAYFGFPRQIESISRAINFLGIGQLHEIALGVCAIASLNLPNDIVSLRDFWRRSLFSGNMARLLAQEKQVHRGERVFVAGLLHEIGHLVLFAEFPQLSRATLQQQAASGESSAAVETKLLGLHYGDIGAFIMQQWGLPDFYQSVTRHQPVPALAQAYALETALVHLGHCIAMVELQQEDTPLENLMDAAAWEMVAISTEQLEPLIEKAGEITADMEATLLAGIK